MKPAILLLCAMALAYVPAWVWSNEVRPISAALGGAPVPGDVTVVWGLELGFLCDYRLSHTLPCPFDYW